MRTLAIMATASLSLLTLLASPASAIEDPEDTWERVHDSYRCVRPGTDCSVLDCVRDYGRAVLERRAIESPPPACDNTGGIP